MSSSININRNKYIAENLGELRSQGYTVLSVKDEMRKNVLAMLDSGLAIDEMFPGIIGYSDSVLPALLNAILSKHDFILLGLRGQAKTRILRSLVQFLDEKIPVIAGTDLNENPFEPITESARSLILEKGDQTPIRWIDRSERYQEKLATPDVTIADLIGDIDPIKAATKRLSYTDEQVIHYGIVPRTNRGIFAINEVPDLPPRIQVGLLNVLEEKDFQIRGFPFRIPLDVCMVFSANPEDYTNRGNIISPLKDRIDSQIITHYPNDMKHAIQITSQEAWENRSGDFEVYMPDVFREIIEDVAFEARNSEFVDQKSGVSARMTISLLENVISNIERRCLTNKEEVACPRLSDLHQALPAITGKLELVYEGEQEGPNLIARKLIGQAIKRTFLRYFPKPDVKIKDDKDQETQESAYGKIIKWFARGNTIEISDKVSFEQYQNVLFRVTDLSELVKKIFNVNEEKDIALGMEITLEGLHQHSMLSKRDLDTGTSYRDMLKEMFGQMSQGENT